MKLIIANWKMYLTIRESGALAAQLVRRVPKPRTDLVICPSFLALARVGNALRGNRYQLGAQDIAPGDQGALTGEVSPRDLRELGCRFVIIGHSERRHNLGEDDDLVRKKFSTALRNKIHPILCVGETAAERRAGNAIKVIRRQLKIVFRSLPPTTYHLSPITIAYEPAWAIGTGKPLNPPRVAAMHRYIRGLMGGFGFTHKTVQVIYGGSVNRKNLLALLRFPEIEGAMIGGASAKSSFVKLIASLPNLL